MNKKNLAAAVSLVLAALSSPYANALDMKWVCGSGIWSDTGCWSSVWSPYQIRLPTDADTVYLTQSDSINRTIDYANTVFPNPVFYQLTVDATGSGSMTLSQTKDALAASFVEVIGDFGKGSVIQSGGTNTVQGSLYLGLHSGSTGNYDLSGTGTLLVGGIERVGGDSGTGTFTQNSGTHTVQSALYLGYVNSGSQGTYNLNGGVLTVGSIIRNSSSTFNFNAGILNITGGSPVNVGGNNSFVSTISLDTGKVFNVSNQLTINAGGVINSTGGTLSAGNVYSNGTINQSNGANTINNTLYLSASNGGTGTYNFYGGSLTVGSIKGDGTGVFNFGAGTLNAVDLAVGGTSPLGNTLNLTAGKVASVSNSLLIDLGSTVSMDGGALTVGGVANPSVTNFTQKGGVTTINGDLISSLVDIQGGALNGSGAIVGSVSNSGGTLALSSMPSIMNISGDYTQSSAGALDVEIGFGPPTTLNVGGTASLHGILNVSSLSSFYPYFYFGTYPQLGDSFNILSATNLVGSFDVLNLAPPGLGLAWTIDYLHDQDALGTDYVRLSVVAVPEPESYTMILAGLGIVGAVARRKKRVAV